MKVWVSFKKKKKKHGKILWLAKSKLNNIEVLICVASIYLDISQDEFVLLNNVLKEFDHVKEEIKSSNDKWKFKLYIKQCYRIVSSCID